MLKILYLDYIKQNTTGKTGTTVTKTIKDILNDALAKKLSARLDNY